MAGDTETLTRIAYLYYKEELTQQKIAEQFGLSRPKVARLLQEAHRRGIVRIEITHELPQQQKDAYALQRLFGLDRAVVVETRENRTATIESIRGTVASLIAERLGQIDGLGFSFSQTIGNIADYMRTPADSYHVNVCDMMGAMMGFPMPYTASTEVAKRVGGSLYPISAPIMVLDPANLSTYLNDPNIKKSMEAARSVDLAVMGIGDFTTQNILYRSGYINEETINNLRRQGIVGELCMRFFDLHGQHVESELDARVISVDWDDLVRIPRVMAVATGSNKVRPTIGALKTGIVQTLVTDSATAQQILLLHKQFNLPE